VVKQKSKHLARHLPSLKREEGIYPFQILKDHSRGQRKNSSTLAQGILGVYREGETPTEGRGRKETIKRIGGTKKHRCQGLNPEGETCKKSERRKEMARDGGTSTRAYSTLSQGIHHTGMATAGSQNKFGRGPGTKPNDQ